LIVKVLCQANEGNSAEGLRLFGKVFRGKTGFVPRKTNRNKWGREEFYAVKIAAERRQLPGD
jgi:hypothetical protein